MASNLILHLKGWNRVEFCGIKNVCDILNSIPGEKNKKDSKYCKKKWDDKFCAKTGKVSAVNSINQKHVYRRDKTIAVIQVSDWFMRQSLVGLLLGQVIIHNIWYLFIAR